MAEILHPRPEVERRRRDERAEREQQKGRGEQDEMDTASIHREDAGEQQRRDEDAGVDRHVEPRRDVEHEVEPLLRAEAAAVRQKHVQNRRPVWIAARAVGDELIGPDRHARVGKNERDGAQAHRRRRRPPPVQRPQAAGDGFAIDRREPDEIEEHHECRQRNEIRQVADRLQRQQVRRQEEPTPASRVQEAVSDLDDQRQRVVEAEVPVRLIEPDRRSDHADRDETRGRRTQEAAGEQPRAGEQDHLVDEHPEMKDRQQVGVRGRPGRPTTAPAAGSSPECRTTGSPRCRGSCTESTARRRRPAPRCSGRSIEA